MYYNYLAAMKDDIREYIDDNGLADEYSGRLDELEEKLPDELWTVDSVTGNGSGSYTFNSCKAKEYIDGDSNAEEYIRELIDEYCLDAKTVAEHIFDWEYWDVSIRCYMLYTAVSEVIEELKEEEEEKETEEV